MEKYKNLIIGSLLVVFSIAFRCTCSRAADIPTYQIVDKGWDSITISVTFTTDSEYNMLRISSPYDSSEDSTSSVMYLKGTYEYTFKNLKNPGALYFITLHYGNNQFREFSVRLMGIPEGKYVRVDLDFEKYLKNNISYNGFIRWLDHLDEAYELYYELVGVKPNNGEIINIVSSPDDFGKMWIYGNTSTIYWNQKYIASELRQIDKEDDWSFGTLHEMGHLFDIDDKWTFDAEFFANFKMAYVLYKKDGNFRVKLNNRMYTKYDDIINYYFSDSSVSYTKSIGANPMKYSADGLTYMFLNIIKEYGWYCIQGTFTYCNDVQEPGARLPIRTFLSVANYFLPKNNPISVAFERSYGDKYQFVVEYLDSQNKKRASTSGIIVD